jgi:chromosome segregation ATPase
MKNHEASKYLLDLDHVQGRVADLQALHKGLKEENGELARRVVELQGQIEGFTRADEQARERQLQAKFDAREREDKERRSLYAILRVENRTSPLTVLAECLTFKEYNALGAVNRAFYKALREQACAKACIHYIKIKYVV